MKQFFFFAIRNQEKLKISFAVDTLSLCGTNNNHAKDIKIPTTSFKGHFFYPDRLFGRHGIQEIEINDITGIMECSPVVSPLE